MGRNFDFTGVPDSNLLPAGMYEVEIESLEERQSKAGTLMYAGVYRVAEGPHTGTPIFDYFNIGNAEDPNADDPETFKNSIGARQLRRLIKAAGITLGAFDETITALVGQHVMLSVDQQIDDGKRDPKYKGTIRNRIVGTYSLGEREPGASPAKPSTLESPRAATTRPGTATAPAPPKAAVRAPKVATVKCGYCKQDVPRAEYVNHVETQHAGEEE
jgi:hypothetical protein